MRGLGAKFLGVMILAAVAWESRAQIFGVVALCLGLWAVAWLGMRYVPEPESRLEDLLARCESGLERKLAPALYRRFANCPGYRLMNQVEVQPPGHRGQPYRPDFIVEKRVGWRTIKCVVEADGPLHFTPEGIARDRKRDRLLRRAGYIIKRFNVKEIGRDPDDCALEVGHAISIASAPYEPQEVSSPQ